MTTTTALIVVAAAYGIITLIMFFWGWAGFAESYTGWRKEKYARMAFTAPFWPYLLFRGMWNSLASMWRYK